MKSQSVRGFAKQALTAFVLTGAALAVQAQTTLTFGGSDAIGSILDKQNISFTKCVSWNYVINRISFTTTRLACMPVPLQYALTDTSPL